MRTVAMTFVLLLSSLLLASCGKGPKVLQGTVVGFDGTARQITVKDELPPGAEVRLSVEGAEIGAAPAAGDTVRVAYREEGGTLRATRVANISRQSEMAGKGGKK